MFYDAFSIPVGDRERYAYIVKLPGRFKFGYHAARTHAGFTLGIYVFYGVIYVGDLRYDLSVGMDVRIPVIYAVNRGKYDNHIGRYQAPDYAGQSVIIPEFYLICRHCVVFIYNRYY